LGIGNKPNYFGSLKKETIHFLVKHLVASENFSSTLQLQCFSVGGQPSSITATLSLPLLKEKGRENTMQRAQGLRQGQGDRSTRIVMGKADAA